MPLFHDVEQRSDEWDALRAGKLTASTAKKLVTPTGKASTQYRGEIARIIAEAMGLQKPEFINPTYWMERGVDLEPEALAWFEVETDLTVTQVGFVTSGNTDHIGLFGASPDGIIHTKDEDDGRALTIPLELKCPKPSTHLSYLMEGDLPKEHIAQVHFQMVLCEAPYAYFASYNPNVRPLILKVEWNDYTETMMNMMVKYQDEYLAAMKAIKGESDAES
jgi:hypothetical protein